MFIQIYVEENTSLLSLERPTVFGQYTKRAALAKTNCVHAARDNAPLERPAARPTVLNLRPKVHNVRKHFIVS